MGILNVFDPQPVTAPGANPFAPQAPAIATSGTPTEQHWEHTNYTRSKQSEHLAAVGEFEKREHTKAPVVAMTDAQRELHAEVMSELRRTFENTDAAVALDAHEAAVERQLAAARERKQQVRDAMTTAGQDTASELRSGRAWDRTRRTLDAKSDGAVVSAVADAFRHARPGELPVLAEEVTPYLESRGVPTEFVDDLIAQADPEYAAACADVRLAEKQYAVCKWNADKVRKEIHGGYQSEVGLVDPTRLTSQVYRG